MMNPFSLDNIKDRVDPAGYAQSVVDNLNRSGARMMESSRPTPPQSYYSTPSIFATRGYTPEEEQTLGMFLTFMTNLLGKAIPRGNVPLSGIPESIPRRSLMPSDSASEYFKSKRIAEEAAARDRVNRMFGGR